MRQDLLAPPSNDRQNVCPQRVGAGRLGCRDRIDARAEQPIDTLGEEGVLAQRLELRPKRSLFLKDGRVVLFQEEPPLGDPAQDLLQVGLQPREALKVSIELADLHLG